MPIEKLTRPRIKLNKRRLDWFFICFPVACIVLSCVALLIIIQITHKTSFGFLEISSLFIIVVVSFLSFLLLMPDFRDLVFADLIPRNRGTRILTALVLTLYFGAAGHQLTLHMKREDLASNNLAKNNDHKTDTHVSTDAVAKLNPINNEENDPYNKVMALFIMFSTIFWAIDSLYGKKWQQASASFINWTTESELIVRVRLGILVLHEIVEMDLWRKENFSHHIESVLSFLSCYLPKSNVEEFRDLCNKSKSEALVLIENLNYNDNLFDLVEVEAERRKDKAVLKAKSRAVRLLR